MERGRASEGSRATRFDPRAARPPQEADRCPRPRSPRPARRAADRAPRLVAPESKEALARVLAATELVSRRARARPSPMERGCARDFAQASRAVTASPRRPHLLQGCACSESETSPSTPGSPRRHGRREQPARTGRKWVNQVPAWTRGAVTVTRTCRRLLACQRWLSSTDRNRCATKSCARRSFARRVSRHREGPAGLPEGSAVAPADVGGAPHPPVLTSGAGH